MTQKLPFRHLLKFYFHEWVPVNSTGKVSDGCIRDLWFNPAYTKNWLVSWSDDNELSLRADAISWNSLKKNFISMILYKPIVKSFEKLFLSYHLCFSQPKKKNYHFMFFIFHFFFFGQRFSFFFYWEKHI